ncbi:MAG: hypothetical protein MJ252_08590, partial [archaeon]|nr:hypothetical protein [archaeon]
MIRNPKEKPILINLNKSRSQERLNTNNYNTQPVVKGYTKPILKRKLDGNKNYNVLRISKGNNHTKTETDINSPSSPFSKNPFGTNDEKQKFLENIKSNKRMINECFSKKSENNSPIRSIQRSPFRDQIYSSLSNSPSGCNTCYYRKKPMNEKYPLSPKICHTDLRSKEDLLGPHNIKTIQIDFANRTSKLINSTNSYLDYDLNNTQSFLDNDTFSNSNKFSEDFLNLAKGSYQGRNLNFLSSSKNLTHTNTDRKYLGNQIYISGKKTGIQEGRFQKQNSIGRVKNNLLLSDIFPDRIDTDDSYFKTLDSFNKNYESIQNRKNSKGKKIYSIPYIYSFRYDPSAQKCFLSKDAKKIIDQYKNVEKVFHDLDSTLETERPENKKEELMRIEKDIMRELKRRQSRELKKKKIKELQKEEGSPKLLDTPLKIPTTPYNKTGKKIDIKEKMIPKAIQSDKKAEKQIPTKEEKAEEEKNDEMDRITKHLKKYLDKQKKLSKKEKENKSTINKEIKTIETKKEAKKEDEKPKEIKNESKEIANDKPKENKEEKEKPKEKVPEKENTLNQPKEKENTPIKEKEKEIADGKPKEKEIIRSKPKEKEIITENIKEKENTPIKEKEKDYIMNQSKEKENTPIKENENEIILDKNNSKEKEGKKIEVEEPTPEKEENISNKSSQKEDEPEVSKPKNKEETVLEFNKSKEKEIIVDKPKEEDQDIQPEQKDLVISKPLEQKENNKEDIVNKEEEKEKKEEIPKEEKKEEIPKEEKKEEIPK